MTDLAWEFEEPEPVEASHLLRVTCCACGARGAALAAPGQERRARCTSCAGSSVADPALAGRYAPVPRFGVGLIPVAPQRSAGDHPEPSISSRSGEMGTRVGVVEDLAAAARSAGWSVKVTYARGHGIHGGHGGVLAERDSWAVTGALGARRFAAVRVGDGWPTVWMISPELGFFGAGGVSDLKEWIRARGETSGWRWWREHLAARDEERGRSVKNVKCPGGERCLLEVLAAVRLLVLKRGRLHVPDHTHRANGDIKPKRAKARKDYGD